MQNGGKAHCAKDVSLGDPFVYRHLGSMASVGRYKALVDLRQSKVINFLKHFFTCANGKFLVQWSYMDITMPKHETEQ